MDKFGKLIREARIEKKETPKELAKILDCSVAFVGHIEGSKIVPVSPRLINNLKKHFKSKAGTIEKLSKRRNAVGKSWYRKYRKEVA